MSAICAKRTSLWANLALPRVEIPACEVLENGRACAVERDLGGAENLPTYASHEVSISIICTPNTQLTVVAS